MIGMGAMIGAGIFVLTGVAAEIAGPAAILVFAANGVVTTFTAFSYAELASAVPKSGGGYAFVREAFDDTISFIMGWMLWFAYMIAGTLYALGFAPNFAHFVHEYIWSGFPAAEGNPLVIVGLAMLAVAGFVGLNALSTEASGGAETIVTIIKIIVLLIFAGFGAMAANTSEFEPFLIAGTTESSISILRAMGLSFIAFEGYDLITTITEEVENPRKNIPRAIFISLGATVAIYMIVVFVAIGTLGAEGLGRFGETGIARAAEGFMPLIPLVNLGGGALIAFGAVFSTISALNAVIIASSRIAFAMGREQQFPRILGQIHPRFGTPWAAVLVSAIVMLATVGGSLAVGDAAVRAVGNLSSLFFLLSFVVVNGAVIKLRRDRPDLRRPYEMPLYPVPPVLGIVMNLVLGLFLPPFVWAIGIAWLLLGGGVYVLLTRYEIIGERATPDDPGPDPEAEIEEPAG